MYEYDRRAVAVVNNVAWLSVTQWHARTNYLGKKAKSKCVQIKPRRVYLTRCLLAAAVLYLLSSNNMQYANERFCGSQGEFDAIDSIFALFLFSVREQHCLQKKFSQTWKIRPSVLPIYDVYSANEQALTYWPLRMFSHVSLVTPLSHPLLSNNQRYWVMTSSVW